MIVVVLFMADTEKSQHFLSLSHIADIGANLTDEVFDGIYNGSRKHDSDRQQVMDRAFQMGVQKIIITVGTIFDCEPAFKLAENDGESHSLFFISNF